MFRLFKLTLASLTFVIIGIAAAPPAQADIIVNGSFETPDIPDNSFLYNPTGATWTFAGNSGIIDSPSGFFGPPAPNGEQYAFLQTCCNVPSFSQSITLPSAGQYTLSYFDAGRPPGIFNNTGNVAYQVFLDSTLIASGATTTAQPFTFRSFNFNANAGTFTLSFRAPTALSPDDTAFFDAISIAPSQAPPSAVPEPTTLLLLGTGLAGVAVKARKRRKA